LPPTTDARIGRGNYFAECAAIAYRIGAAALAATSLDFAVVPAVQHRLV
jgi:hypothetical protein